MSDESIRLVRADHCVICGSYVPEGSQVCRSCMKTYSDTGPQESGIILDSGTRQVFETGAVRDIQFGKGRCDLLPLTVVENLLGNGVFRNLANFQRTGNTQFLYNTLDCLSKILFDTSVDGSLSDTSRLANMLLEVSKHFESGAIKYGEHNWQKGLPVHCYINSAVRHYLKWLRGDTDENHDRAAVWNILCCIWTVENKPELEDFYKYKECAE